MISMLLALIIFCVVAGVLCYVARAAIGVAGLPAPWANLAYALVCLLILCLFLNEVGWIGAPHAWRGRW